MTENLKAIFEENNILRHVDKDVRNQILITIIRADSIAWVCKSKEGIDPVSIIGSFAVTAMCKQAVCL
jgi:hypothetical protein